MRSISANLLVSVGLAVQGCAAMSGVEPTNLSDINAGTSQQQAETVLGKPIETANTDLGLAAVYKYDKGGPPVIGPQLFPYFLLIPFLWPFAEHDARSQQERLLTILYDQEGQMVSAFWDDQLEALRGVAQGDVHTIFELGKRSRPGSDLQFLWYCHAAQKNHVVAQYLLAARFYESGAEQVGRDLKKAYFWYSLASKNGDETASSRLGRLKPQLNATDILDADILVKVWRPNPANCKEEVIDWKGDGEVLNLLEHLSGVRHP
jgi:hypothetical protein